MSSIADKAKAYKPAQALTVADLDVLDITLPTVTKTGTGDKGNYTYEAVVVNGKEYRIPNPVFEKVQTILDANPNVTKVQVTKSGSGLASKYRVTALV